MGGGDLNSKKSWHPNTMKNQERVWKAEKEAAAEKQRIIDLQRERAQERDRSELNEMAKRNFASAGTNNENRLHWMYDKPDKKGQQEDYLLGKSIDKNYDKPDNSEDNVIPAVSRRVVGSSLLTSAGDSNIQVDLVRKMREDPLLLVKERERAARAALLNNPLHRKRLTELLRKEQIEKKESKEKKKEKKKSNDLDALLAAKLSSVGGDKGINLASLLDSNDSSSDSSSSDEKHKAKKRTKKKKSKKSKRKKLEDNSSDDEHEYVKKNKKKNIDHSDDDKSVKKTEKLRKSCSQTKCKNRASLSPPRKSRTDRKDFRGSKREEINNDQQSKYETKNSATSHRERPSSSKYRRHDSDSDNEGRHWPDERGSKAQDSPRINESRYRRYSPSNDRKRKIETETSNSKKRIQDEAHRDKGGVSEAERAARLAEMAAAGAEREQERAARVLEQRRAERDAGRQAGTAPRRAAPTPLPASLEARLHSNRHYIQRDQRHMNEHFARR